MRSSEDIKERIRMAIVEEMNNLPTMLSEPENQLPQFLDKVTNHINEIVLDEINFRRRF